MAITEEIRGITWDLWGDELSHEQTIQRIVRAGFPIRRVNPQTGQPESPLLIMFAIVEGESGEYIEAWHINVERNDDGTIKLFNEDGTPWDGVGPKFMHVLSIDLGFMQFSITVSGVYLEMDAAVVQQWVELQFQAHPHLAIPQDAADAAYQRWLVNGYSPWFAYINRNNVPGAWHTKLKEALVGFDAWLIHSFIGPDADGKLPVRVWQT